MVGLAAFVAIELRVSAPMVEFALFRTRQFIGSNLIAFIITFAMMGTFFFMAIYMQDILGYQRARGRHQVPADDGGHRHHRADLREACRPARTRASR